MAKAGRKPLYNRKLIGALLNRLIATENQYAPFSDRALAEIIQAEGEDCTQNCVFELRAYFGIGNSPKRRAEYEKQRKAKASAR